MHKYLWPVATQRQNGNERTSQNTGTTAASGAKTAERSWGAAVGLTIMAAMLTPLSTEWTAQAPVVMAFLLLTACGATMATAYEQNEENLVGYGAKLIAITSLLGGLGIASGNWLTKTSANRITETATGYSIMAAIASLTIMVRHGRTSGTREALTGATAWLAFAYWAMLGDHKPPAIPCG